MKAGPCCKPFPEPFEELSKSFFVWYSCLISSHYHLHACAHARLYEIQSLFCARTVADGDCANIQVRLANAASTPVRALRFTPSCELIRVQEEEEIT